MKVSDFDYDLPRELIAQEPAERRQDARLLVPSKADGFQHARVADLPSLLQPGDLVVVNDTRVRRARMFARRSTGGRVELFLLGPESSIRPDWRPANDLGSLEHAGAGSLVYWRALVNPARKIKPGERLQIESSAGAVDDQLGWEIEAIERLPNDSEPDKPGPAWIVAFRQTGQTEPDSGSTHGPEIEALIEGVGHVPLPPYIARQQGQNEAERKHEDHDAERYQTVFANRPGAVAAPTAGLHLTDEILAAFADRQISVAKVTLHVGLGTFATVEVEDTRDHHMHAEQFELTEAAAQAVNECKQRGGRVVAIGTTSVRVLESACDAAGHMRAGSGSTEIFITPGSEFRVVDVLLTNFHLPKSTLLMLVSAFIGKPETDALYGEAIAKRYRFFSFGDGMLLERKAD